MQQQMQQMQQQMQEMQQQMQEIQQQIHLSIEGLSQQVSEVLWTQRNVSIRRNNDTRPESMLPLYKERNPNAGSLPNREVGFPATLSDVYGLTHDQLTRLSDFYQTPLEGTVSERRLKFNTYISKSP